MIKLKGVDYASAGPSPAKLKEEGVKFVCRYVSAPGNPKNLTKAEATALREAGLGLVVVFETVAKRALAGAAAGRTDAAAARTQAAACGAPKGSPIFFAVDFDASTAEMKTVLAYLGGAASVLGHDSTGVYGGYNVVRAALDAKLCKYAWQTDAWSHSLWEVRAPLRQFATKGGITISGTRCDLNEAVALDYGQWRPAALKPKPVPPAKPGPPPVKQSPDPMVTVTGPQGGLITKRRFSKVKLIVPGLLRRFKKITLH